MVGLADWDGVAAVAVPRTDWMAEVAAASSVLLGLAYILWQKSVATFVAEDRSSELQPEERKMQGPMEAMKSERLSMQMHWKSETPQPALLLAEVKQFFAQAGSWEMSWARLALEVLVLSLLLVCAAARAAKRERATALKRIVRVGWSRCGLRRVDG